jgi:hypothetical protein
MGWESMHGKSYTGGMYIHSHIKTAKIVRKNGRRRMGRRRWENPPGMQFIL